MEHVKIRRKTVSHSVRICCIYCFSDKKSERAKDMHLVKKLGALLKTKSPSLGRYRLTERRKHTVMSFLIEYSKWSNQNTPVCL